jgi:hypothetical protein
MKRPFQSLAGAVAVAGLLAGIVLAGTHGKAWPHQVPGMAMSYPPECCNSAATSPTGDCAPIDDRYVTEESDGYHITLPAGAHPRLKTHGYVAIIPYAGIRQPIDQAYHICLANEGTYRFCFFPKPGNV